jgi:hypothetical protein
MHEHRHKGHLIINGWLFVWAAGEYIAVEKVEAVFKKNSNLEQIWVYGNSYESALVAVVVPAEVRRPFSSFLGLVRWCRMPGVPALLQTTGQMRASVKLLPVPAPTDPLCPASIASCHEDEGASSGRDCAPILQREHSTAAGQDQGLGAGRGGSGRSGRYLQGPQDQRLPAEGAHRHRQGGQAQGGDVV